MLPVIFIHFTVWSCRKES